MIILYLLILGIIICDLINYRIITNKIERNEREMRLRIGSRIMETCNPLNQETSELRDKTLSLKRRMEKLEVLLKQLKKNERTTCNSKNLP